MPALTRTPQPDSRSTKNINSAPRRPGRPPPKTGERRWSGTSAVAKVSWGMEQMMVNEPPDGWLMVNGWLMDYQLMVNWWLLMVIEGWSRVVFRYGYCMERSGWAVTATNCLIFFVFFGWIYLLGAMKNPSFIQLIVPGSPQKMLNFHCLGTTRGYHT